MSFFPIFFGLQMIQSIKNLNKSFLRKSDLKVFAYKARTSVRCKITKLKQNGQNNPFLGSRCSTYQLFGEKKVSDTKKKYGDPLPKYILKKQSVILRGERKYWFPLSLYSNENSLFHNFREMTALIKKVVSFFFLKWAWRRKSISISFQLKSSFWHFV